MGFGSVPNFGFVTSNYEPFGFSWSKFLNPRTLMQQLLSLVNNKGQDPMARPSHLTAPLLTIASRPNGPCNGGGAVQKRPGVKSGALCTLSDRLEA